MSDVRTMGELSAMLGTFGLKHAPKQLPDLIEAADANGLTCREFLGRVLDCELRGRSERKRKRNYSAAHFPPNPRQLGEFDPSELEGGITSTQLAQLAELTWVDNHGNVVLAGPPGLGKTMIATGLGLAAVDAGHAVGFERMESLVRILDNAEVDRRAGFRLSKLQKAQLVIIDEIGYTPITEDQARRFYGFVSGAYERASIIFTTNKEVPDWAELVQDPVLATALMDRILHHARCFSLRGESYRLKHPEVYARAL